MFTILSSVNVWQHYACTPLSPPPGILFFSWSCILFSFIIPCLCTGFSFWLLYLFSLPSRAESYLPLNSEPNLLTSPDRIQFCSLPFMYSSVTAGVHGTVLPGTFCPGVILVASSFTLSSLPVWTIMVWSTLAVIFLEHGCDVWRYCFILWTWGDKCENLKAWDGRAERRILRFWCSCYLTRCKSASFKLL